MAESFFGNLWENAVKGIEVIKAPIAVAPKALDIDRLRTPRRSAISCSRQDPDNRRGESLTSIQTTDSLRRPHSNILSLSSSPNTKPQTSIPASPQLFDRDKEFADAITDKKGDLYIAACQKYRTDNNFKNKVDILVSGKKGQNLLGEWKDDIAHRLNKISEMSERDFSKYKNSFSQTLRSADQTRVISSKAQMFINLVGVNSAQGMAKDSNKRQRGEIFDSNSMALRHMDVQDRTGVRRELPKPTSTPWERVPGLGRYKECGGGKIKRVGAMRGDLQEMVRSMKQFRKKLSSRDFKDPGNGYSR